EQVLGGLRSHPLEPDELLPAEPVEVGGVADQPRAKEAVEDTGSYTPDIHRRPGRQMTDLLPHLGRAAGGVRTAGGGLALQADDFRAAHRAPVRHRQGPLAAGAGRGEDLDDFGDDVAGLLHYDPVADPDV